MASDPYYLTDEWRELRNEVLSRDDYTCQECGKVGLEKTNYYTRPLALVAHHVTERKDGGTDTKDNLTTVCRSCHRRLHRKNNQ